MRIFHTIKYKLNLTIFKYKIGDKVVFVNCFGVCWGVKTITMCDIRNNKPVYYYSPSDTPWYATDEEHLHLATKSDLKSDIVNLQNKYGFTPTEWYGCY